MTLVACFMCAGMIEESLTLLLYCSSYKEFSQTEATVLTHCTHSTGTKTPGTCGVLQGSQARIYVCVWG